MTDTQKHGSFIQRRWKSILLSFGLVLVILAMLGSEPPLPMPDDEREFFERRGELLNQAKAAGEGSRTYSDTIQQVVQLANSMEGKRAEDWVCRVDIASMGEDRTALVYCFTPHDDDSRLELNLKLPHLVSEQLYAGDLLKFSGKLARDGHNVKVEVSSAALIERSK